MDRSKWVQETHSEPPRRYHAIFCFTCRKTVPSKSAAKKHMGHEVEYVDERGYRDD